MDKIEKRLAALEQVRPPAKRTPTDAERAQFIQTLFEGGNLLIDGAGVCVVGKPHLRCSAKLLQGLARACNQARQTRQTAPDKR